MFSQSLLISQVTDFIETPSHNLSPEDGERQVPAVLSLLHANPNEVMNILAGHPMIATSYLLSDLADKMRTQHCEDKLGILVDKCLDTFIEESATNYFDLVRCTDAIPACMDKILTAVVNREDVIDRILIAEFDPATTLEQIRLKYPAYGQRFGDRCEETIASLTARPIKLK